MGTSHMISDVARDYATAAGARATWLVRACDVPDLLAKMGLIGAHDGLVVFAGAERDRIAELFCWQHIAFSTAPTAAAMTAASARCRSQASEDERLVPQGSPASYAHPSGISSSRLFWLVPSLGGVNLRVADIRALAEAARAAGAFLIVDNSLPSVFGCHPLACGAHVVIESLDAIASSYLTHPVMAVSVARSLSSRGRRRLADTYAEDAFRLLSFRLGAPDQMSPALHPDEADVAAIDTALEMLAANMQPRFDAAHAVAEYLACHYAVGYVWYPALGTHVDRAIAPTVLEHGFGPVIDFCPTGCDYETPVARIERLCDAWMRVRAQHAGAPFATHVAPVVFERDACFRIVVGIEDPLDIVDSLDQALRLFCNPPEP